MASQLRFCGSRHPNQWTRTLEAGPQESRDVREELPFVCWIEARRPSTKGNDSPGQCGGRQGTSLKRLASGLCFKLYVESVGYFEEGKWQGSFASVGLSCAWRSGCFWRCPERKIKKIDKIKRKRPNGRARSPRKLGLGTRLSYVRKPLCESCRGVSRRPVRLRPTEDVSTFGSRHHVATRHPSGATDDLGRPLRVSECDLHSKAHSGSP